MEKLDTSCFTGGNIPKSGGLEHFLFSIIYGIILPIDFHIFQDGENHQPENDGTLIVSHVRFPHGDGDSTDCPGLSALGNNAGRDSAQTLHCSVSLCASCWMLRVSESYLFPMLHQSNHILLLVPCCIHCICISSPLDPKLLRFMNF